MYNIIINFNRIYNDHRVGSGTFIGRIERKRTVSKKSRIGAEVYEICLCIGSFSRNKNSSGDEIANVNFYAVCPEATGIR